MQGTTPVCSCKEPYFGSNCEQRGGNASDLWKILLNFVEIPNTKIYSRSFAFQDFGEINLFVSSGCRIQIARVHLLRELLDIWIFN